MMAEVKNEARDLEAQTCKELIDYLRQVADFAGFAASIFTDLSEEESGVQKQCDRLQKSCTTMGCRLDAMSGAVERTDLAAQIVMQSIHQIAPPSDSKRVLKSKTPVANISMEDPAFQSFLSKWQPKKYESGVVKPSKGTGGQKPMSPSRSVSRSRRLTAPSAPWTPADAELGFDLAGKGDPYPLHQRADDCDTAVMHSASPIRQQRGMIGLERGRLTKDVELMCNMAPLTHRIPAITEEPDELGGGTQHVPAFEGTQGLPGHPNRLLQQSSPDRRSQQPVDTNLFSPIASHGTSVPQSPNFHRYAQHGGTSVNANPLYLLIPQNERAPQSVSPHSPRVYDHHVRTDSAGAVSVAALSLGEESPASKKKSIELDAIIAEGQASWQQSAWATAQATPRGEEGLQYAQPQDPTVSYEGSVSMDQLRYQKGEVNLPNAPVAEGPVAGLLGARQSGYTPLGQAALLHGHLSFARLNLEDNAGFHTARSFPSQQSNSAHTGSASVHNLAVEDAEMPRSARLRYTGGIPAFVQQPKARTDAGRSADLPKPSIMQQNLAPLHIGVEPQEATPTSLVSPVGASPSGSSEGGLHPIARESYQQPAKEFVRTAFAQHTAGLSHPAPSMAWQSMGVQAPDDVFVPPLDTTPLSRRGVEGNTADGPNFMSGRRPRSPSFPAEIVMRQGPLQLAVHNGLPLNAPLSAQLPEVQPRSWGQSRYVLPGTETEEPWSERVAYSRPSTTYRSTSASPARKIIAQRSDKRASLTALESGSQHGGTSRFRKQATEYDSYSSPYANQSHTGVFGRPEKWRQRRNQYMVGYEHSETSTPQYISGRASHGLKAYQPMPAAPPPDAWEQQSIRQSWGGESALSSLPGSHSVHHGSTGQNGSRRSTPPTSPLQHISPSGTFPRRFGVAPYTSRVLATR